MPVSLNPDRIILNSFGKDRDPPFPKLFFRGGKYYLKESTFTPIRFRLADDVNAGYNFKSLCYTLAVFLMGEGASEMPGRHFFGEKNRSERYAPNTTGTPLPNT
jgi:hypothetical protein